MSETIPIVENVTITDADTQYRWTSRGRCKQVIFQMRDSTDLRFAFEPGKVAAPTEPYFTLKSGSSMTIDGMEMAGKLDIFFAAGSGSKKVEVTSVA